MTLKLDGKTVDLKLMNFFLNQQKFNLSGKVNWAKQTLNSRLSGSNLDLGALSDFGKQVLPLTTKKSLILLSQQ